jgi:hypothetical protein
MLENDNKDWDPFLVSPGPARVYYDWARAATIFSDSGDREDEAEEVETLRAFRLAQVPDLRTIDEELEIDCAL